MTVETDIEALLDADSGAGGVATLLTGGIHAYAALGRLGLNADNVSAAFDGTTHRLKPCAIVKERSRVPDGQIASDDTQKASWRQVVEIWLYADGDAGFSTLSTVADRIYTVLHGKRAGGRLCRWALTVPDAHAPELDNACSMRLDYAVIGVS